MCLAQKFSSPVFLVVIKSQRYISRSFLWARCDLVKERELAWARSSLSLFLLLLTGRWLRGLGSSSHAGLRKPSAVDEEQGADAA